MSNIVTGSQDCTIKLWSIPEHGLESPVTEPQMLFSYKQRRVENVGFHPTVDFCIYSTSYSTLTLWDLTQKKSFISDSNQHKDVIQSVSWREDGTLCSSTCKDKIIRLLDPRSADFVINLAPSHQNLTDSRVVWLGDSSKVLTTGFDATRMRQVSFNNLSVDQGVNLFKRLFCQLKEKNHFVFKIRYLYVTFAISQTLKKHWNSVVQQAFFYHYTTQTPNWYF